VIKFGYKLSSEEHPPQDLVRWAQLAEETGFSFAAISDHFHPWTSAQGHSPFVWSVIGAISQATSELEIVTGVTCPTVRVHPAIIAQAAATSAVLLPNRFVLGLGSGENLNEHILGDRWPEPSVRLEMLQEAIEVIRKLWEGERTSHHGRYYTVEGAQLYDVPDTPPPIAIAGSGPKSLRVAGELGDAFIGLAPDPELLKGFDAAGGAGKPRYAEVNVCWASNEDDARRTVYEKWSVAGITGQLMQELAMPAHFEQAAEMVDEHDVVADIPHGPDPDRHIEGIRAFIDAGYDHVWIHQIGPDQAGFFDFYKDNVLPKLA
jgi:coenzyme F420-dependent glucose-6-phosphate dehydrogenase